MNAAIAKLYDEWYSKTGSAEAAATLTAAELHSGRQRELPQPINADYLTVKQAAGKYNIGERTIYRLVEDGLPVTRVGKAIRIRPRELAKRLADSETILR